MLENFMYRIHVNPRRKIGDINKNIYGHFTEHAFRNIYGGLFEPDSHLSNATGHRNDVIELLKDVKTPVLRYPGGNFVSNYHWEDGIGAKESRKKRYEYAWGTVEDNQFGTNEFIQLCKATGAEPYICCNMGSGTIEEAMNWVEYCNSERDTFYANLRNENGFKDPFNVKYWGLGNELYAPWQMGAATNARDYATKALEFGKAIRFADPNAHLIACGFESDLEWNLEVIRVLKNMINSISIHHYSIDWGCFDLHNFQQLMSISEFVNEMIKGLRSGIEGVTGDIYHPMKIALDEWNMFGWAHDRVDDNSFYTLENGIVTASILNTLVRNCNIVEMANYSVFVNINGAIQTNKRGAVLRPQYYVFKLFAHHMNGALIDSEVISETFDVNMPIDRRVIHNYYNEAAVEKGGRLRTGIESHARREIKYLDSVATIDDRNRRLCVSLINKHPEHAIDCAIAIPADTTIKEARLHSIHSERLNDYNDENREPIGIQSEALTQTGQDISISIPRHSINLLELTF